MKKLKAILLIDDDTVFTWLTKTLLDDMEVVERVDLFNDPELALDYLVKLASTQDRLEKYCPDIIFLDIKMPILNGFDFLDRVQMIKGFELVYKRIVVLSSSVLEMDISKALSYGVHSYQMKPLTESTIRDIINTFQQESIAQREA